MKISVIIPVYNVEKYLRQCVDSVLGQTYENIEVILVDDGSQDKSVEICDEYLEKDSRVIVIHKINGGASSAREAGVSIVTGSYVMFVDGDDWLDTNAIKLCVEEIKKSKTVECVMFSYAKETEGQSIPMHILDETTHLMGEMVEKVIYRRLFGLLNSELSHPERMENMSSCCMKLYRADVAKRGEYFDIKKIGSCEDGLFNMYALHGCNEIVYLDLPLYHYRKTEGSATSSFRPLFVQQWGTLFSIMEDIAIEKDLGEEYKESLDNRIALSITAIGLNELRNKENSHIDHVKVIRDYLKHERYQKSIAKLQIKNLPLPWKLLMISCKARCAIAVYCAIVIIEKLRKR